MEFVNFMGEELNSIANLNQLLGLDRVAEMLDISLREVQRRIAAKDLPQPVKIGRLSKLPLDEVLGYIERLKSRRKNNQ
jgi:predicted DNA-binding transcriptional regulator AlpA